MSLDARVKEEPQDCTEPVFVKVEVEYEAPDEVRVKEEPLYEDSVPYGEDSVPYDGTDESSGLYSDRVVKLEVPEPEHSQSDEDYNYGGVGISPEQTTDGAAGAPGGSGERGELMLVLEPLTMQVHAERVHTQEEGSGGALVERRKPKKEHICLLCTKNFKDSTKLKEHMRCHTGERPYPCNVCKKGFIKSGDLRRHERSHTGEKPYSCKICQKLFSESTTLRRHERICMARNLKSHR
ncbi:zinc finger protein 768-like [Cydia pomonella]|uniref:zinc finger protein 768-like n=1 Tax=Cydia pomonella TaxID=82600 RepID=UPI002ADDF268|nr:zinc finger protein 768-like [Cydia pomonella]